MTRVLLPRSACEPAQVPAKSVFRDLKKPYQTARARATRSAVAMRRRRQKTPDERRRTAARDAPRRRGAASSLCCNDATSSRSAPRSTLFGTPLLAPERDRLDLDL